MSLVPTCVVCDALLDRSGETLCARCKQDCPDCGGDVAYCTHPLSGPLPELQPENKDKWL